MWSDTYRENTYRIDTLLQVRVKFSIIKTTKYYHFSSPTSVNSGVEEQKMEVVDCNYLEILPKCLAIYICVNLAHFFLQIQNKQNGKCSLSEVNVLLTVSLRTLSWTDDFGM